MLGRSGRLNDFVPLLVAATPIGDVDDASPRLRQALETADVIAAEDTRRILRLARMLGIRLNARLVAVYDAVERGRSGALLDEVAAGRTVLLVTDAGTPIVSDPGYVLVATAAARGLPVSVLPGPSAVTAAVAVAGIPADRFCFEGFLPRRGGERRARLAELATDPRALVVFEAPRRLAATLTDLAAVFGADRSAAVCRELTKTHEEVRRGTLGELADWAGAHEVLGEITLVIAGANRSAAEVPAETIRQHLDRVIASGSSRRDAVTEVAAELGVARRRVYEIALDQ
jgi:16S rRNA (cytidine1402-2'-O)-methyltransferase